MKRYIEVKHCKDPNHPRQFSVENSEADTVNYGKMKWDDYYIHFGGYFGNLGPHVFAAAPDLLEALEDCLAYLTNECSHMTSAEPERHAARAAIAKAKGQTK